MKSNIDRRQFLKISGLAAAAAGCLEIFEGCTAKESGAPDGQMSVRTNPKNGDKVSLLGYGCMRWPMTKDEEGNETVDQEQVNRLVDHAIAHGVNYFDSAPVYHQGKSEIITGIALSRYPRESYFIATKMSNFKGDRPSLEEGIEMYRNSLKAFNTDYIDYYLLHSVSGEEVLKRRFLDNGLLDFLLEERKAGRIRNLGFSFHGKKEGFDYLLSLHEKYHWDFVQIQLNYVDWTHASSRNTDASYLQEELDKKGIPSIIMEPLLGGRLAKLPEHLVDRLKERDPKRSTASWAFRFAGTHEGVLSVLSGMTYMEHLEDNLSTYSPLQPLTTQDMAFLEETAELMQNYPVVDCTACSYCMPCPYGIDIPAIFFHYNKCINEGLVSPDSGSEDYRKNRRAYLISYDRAVPEISQADHCIGCGQCAEACPQGIEIPRQLFRIGSYIEQLRRNKF